VFPRLLGGPLVSSNDSLTTPSLAVARDGERLFVVDRQLVRWDLKEEMSASIGHLIRGATYSSTVQTSPNGDLVAVSGSSPFVLNAEDGEWIGVINPGGSVSGGCSGATLRLSPDGSAFARSADGTLSLQSSSGALVSVVSYDLSSCSPRIAFTHDGQRLVTSDLAMFSLEPAMPLIEPRRERPFYGYPDSLALSPDDRTVVLSEDCERVYDGVGALESCDTSLANVEDGTLIPVPDLFMPFPSFSPEGHWVAAGDRLLHLPTGEIREIDRLSRVSTFLPNGDLVAAENDGTITRYCRR
jgi:hypothetical protein